MMNIKMPVLLCSICMLFTACAPIKVPVSNQYKLERYSVKRVTRPVHAHSLLVSPPEAMPGYQTEEMLYVKTPFELNHFAHNAWISNPATMLYPLVIQSLQESHYFFAIASGPYSDKTDYRLDTQLIELQQNFLKKPSVLQMTTKVVITYVPDNRVVASRIMSQQIPCPQDTPYGGVIAANQAAQAFTAQVTDFVIEQVKNDHKASKA